MLRVGANCLRNSRSLRNVCRRLACFGRAPANSCSILRGSANCRTRRNLGCSWVTMNRRSCKGCGEWVRRWRSSIPMVRTFGPLFLLLTLRPMVRSCAIAGRSALGMETGAGCVNSAVMRAGRCLGTIRIVWRRRRPALRHPINSNWLSSARSCWNCWKIRKNGMPIHSTTSAHTRATSGWRQRPAGNLSGPGRALLPSAPFRSILRRWRWLRRLWGRIWRA